MQAYIRTNVVLARPQVRNGRPGFLIHDVLHPYWLSEEEFQCQCRPVSRRELTLLKSTETELGISEVSADTLGVGFEAMP